VEGPAHDAWLLGAPIVLHTREADGVDPVVVEAPVAEEAQVAGGEEFSLEWVEEEGAEVVGGGGEEDRAVAAARGAGEGLCCVGGYVYVCVCVCVGRCAYQPPEKLDTHKTHASKRTYLEQDVDDVGVVVDLLHRPQALSHAPHRPQLLQLLRLRLRLLL
jgi:hypothetical protein